MLTLWTLQWVGRTIFVQLPLNIRDEKERARFGRLERSKILSIALDLRVHLNVPLGGHPHRELGARQAVIHLGGAPLRIRYSEELDRSQSRFEQVLERYQLCGIGVVGHNDGD